jgi:hypothetical protein
VVRHSFRFAHVLCLSIRRVRVPGDMGSFFVYKHGARVHGNLRIWWYPGWGVGGRWWQPYPSHLTPMVRYCVGVLKSLALANRPVLGDHPIHLTLSSNSSHITCMIINCSLHSYFWPCLLHLGLFFYSLFSFYPWGWLRCVSTILEIPFFPGHKLSVY